MLSSLAWISEVTGFSLSNMIGYINADLELYPHPRELVMVDERAILLARARFEEAKHDGDDKKKRVPGS